MTGTLTGGKKAARKCIEKFGKDYYKNIGRIGGSNSCRGGFASEKVGKDGLTGTQRAKIAGAIGGRNGRRGPAKHPKDLSDLIEKHPSRSNNLLKDYIETPEV